MHNGRLVAQGPPALLAVTSPDFRQLVATYKKETDVSADAFAVA